MAHLVLLLLFVLLLLCSYSKLGGRVNIYTAVSGANSSLEIGDRHGAEFFLDYAEEILKARDPQGNIQAPAICCFNVKNGIISCDDIVWIPDEKGGLEKFNNGKLYPGTLHERYASCKACRDNLRAEIKTLKVALKAKPAYSL